MDFYTVCLFSLLSIIICNVYIIILIFTSKGAKAIVPWGCVQRTNLKLIGCNFRELVLDKLNPITVWVERHKDNADESVKSNVVIESVVGVFANKINEIEKRQEALELFLQNYVVDMTFYTDKRITHNTASD